MHEKDHAHLSLCDSGVYLREITLFPSGFPLEYESSERDSSSGFFQETASWSNDNAT